MKRSSSVACRDLLLVAAAAVSFLAGVAQAAPIAVDSKITAATVYADRAVISRTGSLNVPAPGVVAVAFEGLPDSLIGDSLTVTGRGDGPVTILDITGQEIHVDFTPNARVKSVEDELQALKRRRRQLEDRGNVLKAQDASLTRLENAATSAPTKDSAPRLTIDESAKLLVFLEDQRMKLARERESIDDEVQDLGRKMSALEKTLAELRGAGGRSTVTVIVRLDVAKAGRVELVLGYALPGARWEPSYDVRAESGNRMLTLGYFGVVQQNTGEDWKDVALTLSTARPNLGGAAPKLAVWAVDIGRPTALGAMTAAPAARAGAVFKGAPAEGEPVKLEMFQVAAAQARVEEGATSASFVVAAATTILSDNAPQKVPITTAKLGLAPEYLTVPKKLAAAFLTAKITNTSEFPLLPGRSHVFLDGTFVASTPMRAVMPGEKFDLQLGADEGISVKHRRVNRFTEDTGLTNSGKRVTYEYLITIQNNKRTTERIVVNDQVPISRNEKVVVKQLAPAEKEIKPSSEGTLTWTLDLKPGEKRELKVKFSVEHPNDIIVAGLDA